MADLETKDPTVAVLIERLNRHMEDFAEFRSEMREEVKSIRKDIANTADDVSGLSDLLKNGKFLWSVVVGLGFFVSWSVGVWDKIGALLIK